MMDLVPSFDNEQIAQIVLDLYGIEGEVLPLDSFEDQNTRIKTKDGSYVFKIANSKWEIDSFYFQNEVLERFAKMAPSLKLPVVIPTLKGESLTIKDGFPVRLLTYLDGNVLSITPRCPELYRDMGRFMGRFNQVMNGYSHPAQNRPEYLWNLDNVMAAKPFISDVKDAKDRGRIEFFFKAYEMETLSKIPDLRKAVIHGDANEFNILVDAGGAPKVVGLIDFGDLSKASIVNELAIMLAYGLLGEEHVEISTEEMIKGFHTEFPLEESEYDVLFNLTAMRLVQSLILSSNRAKLFPENDYIIASQKPIKLLLKKLAEDKNLKTTFKCMA
ncbi:MAG: phosphotransferase [Sphingomonadales bacterium]